MSEPVAVPFWLFLIGALFAAWALYLLDSSLRSEAGFEAIRSYFQLPLVKLGMLLFIWAYCHHLCAGIRFLLLDIEAGVELRPARISSFVVLLVSLALTAILGARLW